MASFCLLQLHVSYRSAQDTSSSCWLPTSSVWYLSVWDIWEHIWINKIQIFPFPFRLSWSISMSWKSGILPFPSSHPISYISQLTYQWDIWNYRIKKVEAGGYELAFFDFIFFSIHNLLERIFLNIGVHVLWKTRMSVSKKKVLSDKSGTNEESE